MATQDLVLTPPSYEEKPTPEVQFSTSPSIGKLIEALAKAQKDFKPILKEAKNPFFNSKYADLASVIAATKEGLSTNGLAVLQPPAFERKTQTVEILTLLAHSSGEWIRAVLRMPVSKLDAQGVGSAITYGRRYAYSAVLNVASEEDDDGNAAVSKDFKESHRKEETSQEFDQRTSDQQAIAPFQISAIDEACKRSGKTPEEVAAYLGLIGHKRIEHVLKSEFNEFLQWANGVKKKSLPALKLASQIPSPDPAEKARKRMWAVASEFKIPEGDVKQCIYERYKVKSSKDLTVQQYEDMAQWIKEVAAAVSES